MEKKKSVGKKKKNTFRTSEVITLVLVTIVISMAMGFLLSYPAITKNNGNVKNEALQKFVEEYSYIEENYYGELDETDVLNKALETIIDELGDDYTEVISETEKDYFNKVLMGSYEGIGIAIYNDNDGNIIISDIFADSPAFKAGLEIGDTIIKYNDESLKDLATSDLVNKIKKAPSFDLTVLRNKKEIKVSLNSELINIKSIASSTFEKDDKKVGYIYASIFAENTSAQFKEALLELESNGIDSLIIDLRNNSGGHLDAAHDIISLFLDDTHVIYQTESKKEKKATYSSGDKTKTYKLAILVNGTSASASEVVTAALKEEYGATVIGTTTYGKGTVQELITLNSGIQYKFTTKKWLTPNGTWINKTGITPDVIVSLDEKFFKNPSNDTDNQLQKAIETLLK